MAVFTHVVGTYGQLIQSGPFMDTSVDPAVARDMTGFAVTARFIPPVSLNLATFTRVGQGTADGFIQYRLADGDLVLAPQPAVPQAGPTSIWYVRMLALDADELLPGDVHKIYVIPEDQHRDNAPTAG